jgi:GNAT superfamily N-acetyltransferase
MMFSDLALAQKLEAAEAFGCAGFAASRKKLFPNSISESIEVEGTTVVFDGINSPITQTFGLGLFAVSTSNGLDKIEEFFSARGASTQHELSPFAGVQTLALLCQRSYTPIEISHVMYQPIHQPAPASNPAINIRLISSDEAELWSRTSASAWSHDHPEYEEFMQSMGKITAQRENSPCFLAELNGIPAATATIIIHNSVALFAGAATLPAMRRNGLQRALLDARMQFAADAGCEIAMMVTEAGSQSQKNGEHQGFRIAYTRTKWLREVGPALK